eukprot:1181440-Prorocentrum_minimum.AAC.1
MLSSAACAVGERGSCSISGCEWRASSSGRNPGWYGGPLLRSHVGSNRRAAPTRQSRRWLVVRPSRVEGVPLSVEPTVEGGPVDVSPLRTAHDRHQRREWFDQFWTALRWDARRVQALDTKSVRSAQVYWVHVSTVGSCDALVHEGTHVGIQLTTADGHADRIGHAIKRHSIDSMNGRGAAQLVQSGLPPYYVRHGGLRLDAMVITVWELGSELYTRSHQNRIPPGSHPGVRSG